MRTPTMRQLIVTTALTLPVTAAGTGMVNAQAENACAELEQYLEQDMPEGIPQTEEELNQILESGNAEQCAVANVEIQRVMEQEGTSQETAEQQQDQQQQDQQQAQTDAQQTEEQQAEAQQTEEERLAETERTRVELSDEVVIEGEVFVDQQAPEVDVESGETEVMVQDARPEVTLSGDAPEIVVREAPSTIRLDMPQPTITIERQAPEIIVTMPPANVDIADARPQVEVRQSEPTVTVRRTNPSVDLQLSQAEDPEASEGVSIRDRDSGQEMAQGETAEVSDAQVNLAQQEPVVTYQDGENQQASVQVERGQPNIRYEAAEPQIEVNRSGEPQIEVTQVGEAQVTFRQADASDQAGAETGQQQAAQADATGTAGQEAESQQTAAAEQSGETGDGTQAEEMAQAGDGAPQPADEPQTETAQSGEEAAELPEAEIDRTGQAAEGAGQDVAQAEQQETATPPRVEREGYQVTEANEVQVDALTGSNVYGVNDEDIGEISDLVLSANGEVQDIIVDVGGFLGLGQKPVAVDFDEVAVLREEGGDELRVYVDATAEELENMERYQE